MKSVVISIEGFNLQRDYIIKELSVIHQDDGYQHYQFKTPRDFIPTNQDLKTISFTKKYLNGFSLIDDHHLDNEIHESILKEFAKYTIYVAGEITQRFISKILPETTVIDVYDIMDFKYPKELPDPSCFSYHLFRYCSLAKARYIKKKWNGQAM